jgi:hypothetical protein
MLMTSVIMAKGGHHKLISVPVSINEIRRADGKTWGVLLITVMIAIVIVVAINIFVEKPKVKWPTSPKAPAAAPAQPSESPSEPRSYDVAPPNAVPAQPGAR